jgi:hypothetical protein
MEIKLICFPYILILFLKITSSNYFKWFYMNPSNLHNDIPVKNFVLPSHQSLLSRFGTRDGRKVLMALLLGQLHEVFNIVFHDNIESNQNNSSMECYTMDSKIIQLLISGIVDSGNYTLEGIAYHTRIPFDVRLVGILLKFPLRPGPGLWGCTFRLIRRFRGCCLKDCWSWGIKIRVGFLCW